MSSSQTTEKFQFQIKKVAFDSLIKVNQPVKAKLILDEILESAAKKNDLEYIVFVYSNADKVLQPIEKQQKVDFLRELDKNMKNFSAKGKTIAAFLLKEQLYDYRRWFGRFNYNRPEDRQVKLLKFDEFNNQDLEEYKYILAQEYIKNVKSVQAIDIDKFPYFKESIVDSNIQFLDQYFLLSYITYMARKVNGNEDYLVKEKGEIRDEYYASSNDFLRLIISRTTRYDDLFMHMQLLEKSAKRTKNWDLLITTIYGRIETTKSFANSFSDEKLEKAYSENIDALKSYSEVLLLINAKAKIYLERASFFSWTNKVYEDDYLIALALLEKGIKDYPKSKYREGTEKSIAFIKQEDYKVEMLNKNHLSEKIPVQFSYRNLKELKLSVYKIPENLNVIQDIRQILADENTEICSGEILSFEHKGKYQKRGKTFLLNKVGENGEYLYVYSKTTINPLEMAKSDSLFNAAQMQIFKLNITEINTSVFKSKEEHSILVTDFKTGKPLKKAEVKVYEGKRNRALVGVPLSEGKTDENGLFTFKTDKNFSYSVAFKSNLTKKSNYYYSYYRDDNDEEIEGGTILTDRAIYRPGQTVNYKIIAFKGKKNEYQVVTGRKETVKLLDANYQVISEKTLVLNQFGSAAGTFTLPKSGKLGNYRIQFKNGTTYFSVEEYKRPTFSVEIEKPQNEVKLNDKVTLKGIAKALAGYPIQDASVEYIVKRNHYDYRYWWNPSYNEEIILTKNVKTKDDGSFDIDFTAEDDVLAGDFANYNYIIEARVTNGAGETQKAFETIYVSKVGLRISADIAEDIVLDEKNNVDIKVENSYNIAQENKTLKVKLYKNKSSSDRFLISKFDETEYSNFTKKEWDERFPYSTYNVLVSEELLQREIDLGTARKLDLNSLVDGQGNYTITLITQLENGEDISRSYSFSAVDYTSKVMPDKNVFKTFIKKKIYAVGETMEIQFGSSFANASCLVFIRNEAGVDCKKWLKLNEKGSIKYTIREQDRGGISFEGILNYNGESYTVKEQIYVPFTNKELSIKVKTFRDKLKPGETETWEFTITGEKSELVSTELCATLYDASLDALRKNTWYLSPYRKNNFPNGWDENKLFVDSRGSLGYFNREVIRGGSWKDLGYYKGGLFNSVRANGSGVGTGFNSYAFDSSEEIVAYSLDEGDLHSAVERREINVVPVVGGVATTKEVKEPVKPRTNFSETAFFYPQLRTNEKGEVSVKFTIPESLTEWNFMGFAHSKDLKTGRINLKTNTQKELMTFINAPRFIRENDELELTGQLINLSDKTEKVKLSLNFFDPITNQPIEIFNNQVVDKNIDLKANSTEKLSWDLDFKDFNGTIGYTLIAEGINFSDGEQKVIPVLSDKILVRNAQSFLLTKAGTKTIRYDDFIKNTSSTLRNKQYTLEYTSNPAWNAVLSLPYLTEYPYECAEQTFSRYFGNVLAKKLLDEYPQIKATLKEWENNSPEELQSELTQNEALKQILLTETPWVLEAKNEAEQRAKIKQLFDVNRMANEQVSALRKLVQKQNDDGGFGWFGKGNSNPYITLHIISGIEQLKDLKVTISPEIHQFSKSALAYVDAYFLQQFNELKPEVRKKGYIGKLEVLWLFTHVKNTASRSPELEEMFKYYLRQLEKSWTKFDLQTQARIGTFYTRVHEQKNSNLILASFQDRMITKPNLGAYFTENDGGYFWYNNKTETHAAILEFFASIKAPTEQIENLRLWLILNKEGNAWESTKATTYTVYTLLMNGNNLLKDTGLPAITVGTTPIVFKENLATSTNKFVKPSAGLGAFKVNWHDKEISKDLGIVTVKKSTSTPSIGSLNWTYLEKLENIKSGSNGIKVVKKLYKIEVVNGKIVNTPTQTFAIGDRVKVVLEIEASQDLEYLHVKDLRASGFEPGVTLSQHEYKGGLYYYKSMKNASANFFVDYMSRGKYVLDYELIATNNGSFDGGICSVQCMYAPEFVTNTAGKKVEIK